MKKEDIPSEVFEGYVKRVSEIRTISIEKAISEYEKILKSDKIQKWEAPDSEKAKVAGKILFKNFMSKEPVTEYAMIIPIGMSEPRLTKGSEDKEENMRAVLFAAVKEKGENKKFEVKEIVHTGKFAKMVQNIRLLRAYSNIKLYNKGFFIEAGADTKYDNPQKVKMIEEDIITKIGKFPKLDKLEDVVTHRSKRNEGGYVDRTDMYLIEGMVQRGFKKGYAIKDESLGYEEKPVKVAGEDIIIPQTLTVWVPSRFYKWDEDSELGFLGTIDIGRDDRKPVMNAVYVYPCGFVVEIPEGGKKEKKEKEKEK